MPLAYSRLTFQIDVKSPDYLKVVAAARISYSEVKV